MSQKVDQYFIAPLQEHFESEPTDGGRDTITKDMAEYTAQDLTTAVEWLKRARQSVKTFPSPKECIKAIKAVTGGRQELPVIRGDVITRDNYGDNAVAYFAQSGRPKPPVIEKGTKQWDEWIDYYRWLGVRWILHILLIEGRKKWTVPSEFPGQFDPRFSPAMDRKAA